MNNDPNPHDEAIDKALAALRDAAPPEGMEARIAQRLAQNPAPANHSAPRWRHLLTGPALDGAWWRGAITGAAAALLAVGIFHFAAHRPLRTDSISARAPKFSATQGPATPTAVPVSASIGETQAHPCARPAILRTQPTTQLPTEQHLVAETHVDTAAPSHPAPPLPLTAEERNGLQLPHAADPKAIATPDPETQARLEAQEADEFQKFFSPHQDPTAKENNKQN